MVELLDCTLRDGAYIVDGKFGSGPIRGIIKKLQDANVNIIECGWLKNDEYKSGTTYYHVPDDMLPYLKDKSNRATYVVMIDWDRYDLDYLPEYDGKTIDAIRVVFPHGKAKEGIEVGRKILSKGYRVFFQAANTLAYNDEDLIELAKLVNSVDTESLSIVDTFGAMYEEDLERIVGILDRNLNKSIKLGFHSHNNQQLAFSNSQHFVKILNNSERGIVVDSSLCGMGRGAGNATTELVANYLNRKCHTNYSLYHILDAIDLYMEFFEENYKWGYSTPYFIAGMYCCHVNNIAYLQKNHRTNARDMNDIIESLSPEDRKKYDYDLLEEKYIENQDRVVDDDKEIEELRQKLKDRAVLLIAPGKSSLTEIYKIREYIREKNPVVIEVNAVSPEYDADYLFLISDGRYDYARNAYPQQFKSVKKVLLSNIKTVGAEDEIIINFNRVVKKGWEYLDNAVINCLRLLNQLHVDNVAIAGFDEFGDHYNESYADPALPTVNPDGDWDKLNKEVMEMFVDFKKTVGNTMKIEFVTDSKFNV